VRALHSHSARRAPGAGRARTLSTAWLIQENAPPIAPATPPGSSPSAPGAPGAPPGRTPPGPPRAGSGSSSAPLSTQRA
jgi:hypothetical protein